MFAALFGIRLKNALIFALSDDRFLRHKEKSDLPEPFQGKRFTQLGIPERKALVIAQDLVSRGYNDISLYDDSRENLNAFKIICKAFPEIVYKSHFIDPTWKVRLEEFKVSELRQKTLTSGRKSAELILENHSRSGKDPEAGLKILDEGGEVSLGRGVLLRKDGSRFLLAKAD